MTDTTARFGLPHILPGQAQKELYHNEALALIDGALHPVAETGGDDVPPASPQAGQCWIVGDAPAAEWSGHAGELAIWTKGGWRFILPVDGMTVWLKDAGLYTRWTGNVWESGVLEGSVLRLGGAQLLTTQQPAITEPTGGSTVDGEARTTVTAILQALRAHGLVAE